MNYQEARVMDMDTRLAATTCLVEATSFEELTLWQKHGNPLGALDGEAVNWEQLTDGWLPTVGWMDGRPIVVSLHWSLINSRLVLFWRPTSKLVDYGVIERWFNDKIPQAYADQPNLVTDANNFHIVVHAIDRMNREARQPA